MMKNNKSSKKPGAYKRLFTFVKPYRVRLIIAILFVLFATMAFSLAPYFMGCATNALAEVFTKGVGTGAGMQFLIFLALMGGAYG